MSIETRRLEREHKGMAEGGMKGVGIIEHVQYECREW